MRKILAQIFPDQKTPPHSSDVDQGESPRSVSHHFLDMIHASDLITGLYGEWPSFHDSEIMSIKLERSVEIGPGNIQIDFWVRVLDWRHIFSHKELKKDSLIHFRFYHCTDIHLDSFNQQNQLGDLQFSVVKQVINEKIIPESAVVVPDAILVFIVLDEILAVIFEPEYGLGGGFKCAFGEVVEILPCHDI
jgi:hypothetical protein